MRRRAVWLGGVALVVLAGVVYFFWSRFFAEEPSRRHSFFLPPEAPAETVEVRLFFESVASGKLEAEVRKVARYASLAEQGRKVLEELLAGPEDAGFVSPLPQGTRLLGFYVDDTGCAYADFSREFVRNHPGGTYGELLTVYAVVNTLTVNFPKIKQVKFLVQGTELETLAGHLDLRKPLTRNEGLF